MVVAALKSFHIIAERAGLGGGEPPRQRDTGGPPGEGGHGGLVGDVLTEN